MECWCNQVNMSCVQCENKKNFSSLGQADKEQCKFLLSEIQRDNATHFLRSEINEFEEKHSTDITEFFFRGIFDV